jgi:predicted dehydrogenase
MSQPLDRRHFLGTSALGLAAGAARAGGASDKVVVAVLGMGSRGNDHVRTFGKEPGVEIAYVCDVDRRRTDAAVAAAAKVTRKAPKGVADLRRVLDDKAVDAVVIATPNHWHAPATILACASGKHVYVEKPCSHNPREGELMVEAARRHKRLVQMGTQRRSMPKVIEAVAELRRGVIGRPYFAQSWYTNARLSVGRGKPAPVPDGLDYDLWQGPAPRRPFRDNYLHYTWHWFWHWGNGELGNNGVHTLDVCRWGLGVDLPTRVVSAGGRFRWQDDQETPDTNVVTFDFPDRRSVSWEGLSCSRIPGYDAPEVVFHGDEGSMVVTGGGYAVYDPKGKEVRKVSGQSGDGPHVRNFLDAVRGGPHLNAEIEEGAKSTLLCHLGNIAYRTGRALRCDPATGRILGDPQATALWAREYEKGWEPRV